MQINFLPLASFLLLPSLVVHIYGSACIDGARRCGQYYISVECNRGIVHPPMLMGSVPRLWVCISFKTLHLIQQDLLDMGSRIL